MLLEMALLTAISTAAQPALRVKGVVSGLGTESLRIRSAPSCSDGTYLRIPADAPEKRASRSSELAELARKWRSETVHFSSVTQKVLHPSYQRIIGHGAAAIPFLLQDLKKKPDHWFWALGAITGENPVPEVAQGNMAAMASAWVAWGRQNGHL
jgi:hypothetical protein